jgi:hypothetical protein
VLAWDMRALNQQDRAMVMMTSRYPDDHSIARSLFSLVIRFYDESAHQFVPAAFADQAVFAEREWYVQVATDGTDFQRRWHESRLNQPSLFHINRGWEHVISIRTPFNLNAVEKVPASVSCRLEERRDRSRTEWPPVAFFSCYRFADKR